MEKSKKVYQETVEEFDPWEHFEEEENFTPMKPKKSKVRKMKKERAYNDKKRK